MGPKLACVTCDWEQSAESHAAIEAAEDHQRKQTGHVVKFESPSEIATEF